MEPITDTAGAALLGLKPLTIIGAAVGSFVSLTFFDGQTRAAKWIGVFGGCAIAMLCAEPITEVMNLNPKMETPVALFLAMFGISLMTALAKALKEIKLVDLIWAVLAKFGVNRPPPPPPPADRGSL